MSKSSNPMQAIRGMNDILPAETGLWQWLEAKLRVIVAAYGYQEIRVPVLEKTELFKRSIGEVTDIVEKEMYSFDDRNGDNLSLRPEGTAGCVRACIEHGLLHNQIQRLWYMGPMFRHERPQKGRYRQFHQMGAEAFGMEGPDIDAELILLTARMWRELGLRDVQLQVHSLGTSAARQAYRAVLVDYLTAHRDQLDEDSQRRLLANPLRILDSKNPAMQALIEGAPKLIEHLDAESAGHFSELCERLDNAGVSYVVNPRLVRGMDYYSRTVFEWVTDRLGAQGTVCAGGRYDGLVEYMGGRATPAVGFAMGVERLLALLAESGAQPATPGPHAYLVLVGELAQRQGTALAERLRDAVPGLRLQVNCGGGSAKSQFKRADRSGAGWALVWGDEEVRSGQVSVKPLRGEGAQSQLAEAEVIAHLQSIVDAELD